MPNLSLNQPVSEIRGIGPQFLAKLKKLEIKTIRDLLWHFPYRYEDWSEIVNIADLKAGEDKTIQGTIKSIDTRNAWKRRMVITEAVIEDETGEIKVIWFNQPYIGKILKAGVRANFAGKITERGGEIYLSNPMHETVGRTETKHTARLVPIYSETKGLTSKGIRFMIKSVIDSLPRIEEFIPEAILEKNDLLEVNEAVRSIHFPEKMSNAEKAKERFAYEEIFLLQLRNLSQKLARAKDKALNIEIGVDEVSKLLTSLPFELTKSQREALWEILKDLSKTRPMNRLLQGDVGSGKTILAGLASIIASKQCQVAIMAPTEILARQHYKTFTKFFGSFDEGIGLLVSKEAKIFYGSGLETKTKKETLAKDLAKGKIKILIGTHSLIQQGVPFENLGLIIIDEQHRFGVEQRDALLKNQAIVPHFLSMSATPIPRTLMITIFGDLDLSILSELPKDRKEIITKVVAPENRMKAYAFIRGQVRKGDQVFIVCPRIDPPENSLPAGASRIELTFADKLALDAKTVKEEYERLSKKIFPDLRVSMLHGKIKSAEKEKIMSDFAAGKSDILVSTSVIEVGVDIPNATIIIIENADRFGLAQLYQFRGRVGRGKKQSFCLLFTESKLESARKRLESLITAKNGFELAEYDLKLRGPGEFLGNSQTGLPDIAMQSLNNPILIKAARAAAEEILNTDPSLTKHPLLKEKLRKFAESIHLE